MLLPHRIGGFVVTVSLVFVLGCSQQLRQPTTATGPDPCLQANEVDFFDRMVQRADCRFAHAVRAVALLVNDSVDPGKTFEEQYQFLLDRNIVRPVWRIQSDQWVDRGTLAYMLYRAMALKGGINMMIFGSVGIGERRFAYHELAYRGLMEPGADYTYVTGPELVATVGNADRYMQKIGRYAPPEAVGLGEKTQYKTGGK